MTCSLNRCRQRSLMLCTVAGNTTGKNLPSLRYVSFQLVGILVIDYVILAAEYTNLPFPADSTPLSHRAVGFLCLIISHVNASYHT